MISVLVIEITVNGINPVVVVREDSLVGILTNTGQFSVGAMHRDLYSARVKLWASNLATTISVDKKNANKTGVYEGGGYVSKGVYRPRPNCLMNSFSVDDFCPVCHRAIEKQIRFYSE